MNRTGIGAIRRDQQLALRVRQDEDDNDSPFPANTPLARYAARNENFVPVTQRSGGDLDPDRP